MISPKRFEMHEITALEAALGDGEERHRVVAETASDAIITIDKNSMILSANPATEWIFGYSPDELIGRTLNLLVPTYLERLHEAALRRFVTTGVRDVHWRAAELPGVHRLGHEIPLELSFGEAYFRGELHFIGIVREITERMRGEADRRENGALFRAAFEQAAVGMMQVAPTGRILRANQRFAEMLGYTTDELEQRTFQQITHPDDRAMDNQAVERLTHGGPPSFTLEKRYLKKDGGIVWAEVGRSAVRSLSGLTRTLITVATDITERRRAEVAAKASQARYERNAASAPGMVFQLIRRPDGSVGFPFVSQGARDIFGVDAEEIKQDPGILLALMHREDRPKYEASLADSALSLTPWSWQGRVILLTGEERWVQGASRPERQPDGSILWDGMLTDVTEQRSLQEQLQQAQRMETVGRLAGGIAHDFNNLLTAILSNAELVVAELPDGTIRRDVELIRETAERAAELTRQLMAFSRKQAIESRLVDLNAIVRDTQRMLERTLGAGVKLDADLGPIGPVLCDPSQLQQVLVNLGVNARDAMPGGGTVTIRTHNAVVGEMFASCHAGLQPGRYVVLQVADTGVGMDAETQARIFEPFFTTKDIGKGTGLGLSTVYGIVKQWGGYIAVESATGHGATFTIYLPRREVSATPVPGQPEHRLPGGSETVLVVEDEFSVRSSIRRILARQGYSVLEAQNGAAALRILDEVTGSVDLVMTDLTMPEMSGRELIARLHERPACPGVVVMSGLDEKSAMKDESLPAGTAFLEKPFMVERLLQIVRTTLDAGPAETCPTRIA